MRAPLSSAICVLYLLSPLLARAGEAPESGAGGAAGESPAPPAGDPAQEAPLDTAVRLAKEGRALIKEGRTEEGLSRMREALRRAEQGGVAASDRADLHQVYARALFRADRDEEAAAEMRRACALNPGDAEMRYELAVVENAIEDYGRAMAAAREALRLGLEGEDRESAKELLRKARREHLSERLSVDASVTLAFDSNVLQGNRETIGDRYTGSARRRTQQRRPASMLRGVREDIVEQYRTRTPPRSEYDLPISIYLDAAGRLVAGKRVALWAEYQFSQIFMTQPQPDTDHDEYSLQEHRLSLRLRSEPFSRLELAVFADGFATFTGLREFLPFQGGIYAGLNATLRETKMLRTRLLFTHQYRAAFDRAETSYTNECGQRITESNTTFDGNRDDVGLIQELRLSFLRGRLRYQFHSDRTGVLALDMAYIGPVPLRPGQELVYGCYNYTAPLSYFGHEALLSARFLLPLKFVIYASVRYEHRMYDGSYGATFVRNPDLCAMYGDRLPNLCMGTGQYSLGSQPRRDHRVALDLSIGKELPHGLSVELHYSLVKNISNIENGIDNRSYEKHVGTLWLTYSF